MTTLPAPRLPRPEELTPDRIAAEILRRERIADALLRFAQDYADHARPFSDRAAEYRASAAKLRRSVTA